MAHNVETLAYAGQVPWHGLGVNVDANISTEEMLVKAGLDWTVSKKRLSYKFDSKHRSTDKYALVRDTDGQLMAVVGKDWNPVQNSEALDTFHSFVDAGDMAMETAGSLNEGRDVFALARIKIEREVMQDDTINSYMLFHNPHVFGKSYSILNTNVRVVCNNTLTYAMPASALKTATYRKGHTSKLDIAEAQHAVASSIGLLDKYIEKGKYLADKTMTSDEFVEFVATVIPGGKDGRLTKNQGIVVGALENQPGVEFGQGTWWQGFNAFTYATDHLMLANNERRMNSAWFGQNAARKQKALEVALKMAA